MIGIERKEKVLVIGLDGATFDLILPWAEEGKLPNIARVLKEGCWGELKSTIPANSAPAWVSFATGRNPGKHGIYHFTELGKHTYNTHYHNASTRKSNAVWNILTEEGKRVGIINVPFTYPPEDVNGFLISGIDTPSTDYQFTYPEGLSDEIKREVGDYEIEADLSDLYRIRSSKARRHFLQAILWTDEIRARAASYLMKKYPCDLGVVVFMATDRVQHRFWKFMDIAHPHHDPEEAKEFGNAILKIYQRMDEIVGRFLKEFENDCTIIIMSDHGVGPAAVEFIDLNKWLHSIGLLNFINSGQAGGFASKAFFLAREVLRIALPVKTRHWIRSKFSSLNERLDHFVRLSNIDWLSTKAYSDRTVETVSTIWLNLKGREPDGIVQEEEYEALIEYIIRKLEDLRDQNTDNRIVERVYRKDEIFCGDYTHRAPDLLIKWKDDRYRTQSCIASSKNNSMRFTGDISREESSLTISGEHKENGIFLIMGKNIKKGKKIQGARIIDVAPTILYALGTAVPDDMDGRVLTDVFKEEFLTGHSITYTKSSFAERRENVFSEEEDIKVRERLRGLGYME